MFGLIMTLTAKVAVEMFAKGAGTAITTSLHRNKAEEKKMIEIFLLYHNHKVHYDIITHREFCKAKFEGNINSYNKHSQTL